MAIISWGALSRKFRDDEFAAAQIPGRWRRTPQVLLALPRGATSKTERSTRRRGLSSSVEEAVASLHAEGSAAMSVELTSPAAASTPSNAETPQFSRGGRFG